MSGTEAVHGDSPMSAERASEISKQVLAERGIRSSDHAEGADKGGEALDATTPEADATKGTPAGAAPESTGDGKSNDKKDASTPQEKTGWFKNLPESLQRDYKNFSPEQQDAVRKLAERNLREADYTRKTQEVARKNALALKKAEMLDEILSNPDARARLLALKKNDATSPATPEEKTPSIKDLMATDDPAEFAEGLEQVIASKIESVQEQKAARSPEAKAAKINEQAEAVREALGDKITDEVWARASELFVEQFDSFGENWWDSDPSRVAFNLRAPVRQALLEAQAAATVQGDGSSNAAVEGAGARETSIQSAGSVKTEPVTEPIKGRNAEEIADAAYERTMQKFGISGEEELAKLRTIG